MIISIVAAFGLSQVDTNFSKDFFIPKGSLTEDYSKLLKKYYDIGGNPFIVVYNDKLDYSSEDLQLSLIEFYDKLERCYLCEEQWLVLNTIWSPYLQFR